jgi:Derlin-2/3
MDAEQDPIAWYFSIPVVTRLYLTAAVAITTACFMDWISPLTLYYNYDLIFRKGQYWRIFSSFMFFGSFSLDFLFHLYFVVRL